MLSRYCDRCRQYDDEVLRGSLWHQRQGPAVPRAARWGHGGQFRPEIGLHRKIAPIQGAKKEPKNLVNIGFLALFAP